MSSLNLGFLYNMKISPKLSSSGLKFKVTLASQIRLIFFLEDHQSEVFCLGRKQYAEEGKAVFTARICM